MYLAGEIIVFMALATLIGFAVGRVTRRSTPAMSTAEMTAIRERTTLLEREVDELTAALVAERASNGDTAAQERAEMAEREAAGLGRRLDDAVQRIEALKAERDEWMELAEAADANAGADADGQVSDDDPMESEETRALREELERRTAHIARLEQVAADAKRLERELEARNDRIGDLERVLEANAAGRALTDATAASIGISVGAGNYADSRLTFDPTDGS
jgi:hypothetical protein